MLDVSSIRSWLFALIVLSVVVLGMPTASSAGVVFSVSFGPPPLPVYEQPFCPGDGYIWTPGYWAYDSDYSDYYWVPGTWVRAPRVGFFWTPGYWAYSGTRFVFYEGYWGPQVGFYGGINYGYGYFGNGYDGGRWDRGHFFYNRSVNNVNVTNIHNVYNTTVINRTVNHVSYNGGNGGITARPTRQQETFARQSHLAPVADQNQHRQLARVDREQRASVNHGRPAIAASSRPSDFKDRVPARAAGGAYNPPANRPDRSVANEQQNERLRRARSSNDNKNDRPASAVHPRPNDSRRNDVRPNTERRNDARPDVRPNDRPRADRPPVNARDSRRDQANPRDVERPNHRPDQERQRVQRPEQPNQEMERQRADHSRRQQAERQHQNQKAEQRPQPRAQQQRHEPPQSKVEPQRREQPQPRRQAANRDESRPQKDRQPNQR